MRRILRLSAQYFSHPWAVSPGRMCCERSFRYPPCAFLARACRSLALRWSVQVMMNGSRAVRLLYKQRARSMNGFSMVSSVVATVLPVISRVQSCISGVLNWFSSADRATSEWNSYFPVERPVSSKSDGVQGDRFSAQVD